MSPPLVDDHNNILVPFTFFSAIGHPATYDAGRHLVEIAGHAPHPTIVGPSAPGRSGG